MNLMALSQSDLADQVHNIIGVLLHIRDDQLPDIQNQTVSVCRFSNLHQVVSHIKDVSKGVYMRPT